MKKILFQILALVILIVLLVSAVQVFGVNPDKIGVFNKNKIATTTVATSEVTYFISGQPVVLGKDGVNYFGNEVKYDFDGDGREDTAFLITQSPGGSGTFYYVIAKLNKIDGAVGSNAVLIGDRIAPQSTNMEGGLLVVNYADRLPNEPFTTQPSVGKSLRLKFDPQNNDFGEVVQNFEGEAK